MRFSARSPRRAHGAVVFVFVGLAFASMGAPVADAATTLTLTISTASASPKVPFKNFDGNPPKVFDIDGDGDLEIIAQNDNQYVYVFDSRNGSILFEAKTRFPHGWTARSFNGPEVAVMVHNGSVRLIVGNSAAYITSFWFDPTKSVPGRFTFVKEWERRLDDCFPNPGMDAKPALADLDRDGRLDIVGVTEETGVYALRHDGTLLWKQCIGGGNAEAGIGDLNGDGYPDVVQASDGGTVHALHGRTGAFLWSFSVKAALPVGAGSMPVAPTVAQLDGVGGPDVVVGVRDSHDAVDWTKNHAYLVALNSGGQMLWARQDPAGNPLTYTRPIVVDADGDGRREVYWADWNTNGHNPPTNEADAWKVTGPANFYRYAANGSLVWKTTLGTYWNNKDLALGDVDADGVQEVLANGPGPTGDGIWYLNARTGAQESFVPTHPWKVSRAPILADLWGNGTMQWVVQVEAASNAVQGGGILVFDTGVPFDAAWPHPPYPAAPPPPPPPAGRFDATFTVKSPNAWWQEVFVAGPPGTLLSKVEVRASSGAWNPMAKRSWGAWTSSIHTPAGTLVEFLATSQSGSLAQSAPFVWLDGNLTKPSVVPPQPPPPPPTFEAMFQVPSGVNNHWVEVNVSAIHVITAVSVSVDGGAPVSLTLQPWGRWAKAMFVADGSQVRFVAWNTHNHTATSGVFTWVPNAPPPPPGFNPQFSVPGSVNNWWVEVKVTTPHPVADVSARMNGGAWIALEKKSWGNWAKSFFVATGSLVQFRATSGAGDVAISSNFTWLGAPPPPPPPGPFAATFVVPSGVNNWWIEVKVTATQPVSGVSASVNGGPPTVLTKQSWGNWAKSFFVATGSQVQFFATNASGVTVASPNHTWLGGTLDPGPFNATFAPKSQSNSWWVEVKVDANHIVVKVEASVNNGTWVDLPATTWGTWAKSFFVPGGSAVRFRASNDAGDLAVSGPYTWG